MHYTNFIQIKLASVKLARVYIRRVLTELRSGRHTEKESTHESLIVQGVHFAYRAYQASHSLSILVLRLN